MSIRRPRWLRWSWRGAAVAAAAAALWFAWQYRPVNPRPWSDADLAMVESLWIGRLGPVPPDPSNGVADDPDAAILGNRLFFDTRLSANGRVSCATCHRPELDFTDGLHKGRGIGESARNSRSIVGAAWSPWLYWDGRRDSLWSQALTPLEDADEHGSNRTRIVRLIATEPTYGSMYEALFGALPDVSDTTRYPPDAAPGVTPSLAAAWDAMRPADRHAVNTAFANVGKAIAAYERTLRPETTRFDRYVEALLAGDRERQLELFDDDEVAGLQLFIGEARCTECHNGPLLTNNEFHNTGVLSYPGEVPDRGRIDGVREVLADPFNCLGRYSDDPARTCAELRFARTGPELLGAMRTPSLRSSSLTAPFQHKGQSATLADVLRHYNEAPDAMIGHNEAKQLGLSRRELASLEAFLETLAPPR